MLKLTKKRKKMYYSKHLSRFANTFSTKVKDKLKGFTKRHSKAKKRLRKRKKIYPIQKPIDFRNATKKKKEVLQPVIAWILRPLEIMRINRLKLLKKHKLISKKQKKRLKEGYKRIGLWEKKGINWRKRFYRNYKKGRKKRRKPKWRRGFYSGRGTGIGFIKYQSTLIISRSSTNFFFTFVDKYNEPFFKISTGRLSNNRRKKALAAHTFELIAPYIIKCINIYKIPSISILWKIYSPRHMHTFMRQMNLNKIFVRSHRFVVPKAHNGVRPQKKPRK